MNGIFQILVEPRPSYFVSCVPDFFIKFYDRKIAFQVDREISLFHYCYYYYVKINIYYLLRLSPVLVVACYGTARLPVRVSRWK